MFWDVLVVLCSNRGISPSNLCKQLDLSNSTATKWKNGATPSNATLKKIADYFNVSVDYLLNKENGTIQSNEEGGRVLVTLLREAGFLGENEEMTEAHKKLIIDFVKNNADLLKAKIRDIK